MDLQDDTSGQKNTMKILVTSYMNQLKISQKITFVPHTSISPKKDLSSQCWSQVPMTIYGFEMLVTVRNAGHSVSAIPFYDNTDLPVAPKLTCNAS
ncbi:hypothetical protein C5167_044014 [Papaver somniferum]|uniref:Uncharacterized protein n=1 Tax=Papaver somniferum TaxID=3469 RepID=A0A4Y7LB76_PAPSO|nr:hypothetical protein C5167_044014 [Papaver somniferum]